MAAIYRYARDTVKPFYDLLTSDRKTDQTKAAEEVLRTVASAAFVFSYLGCVFLSSRYAEREKKIATVITGTMMGVPIAISPKAVLRGLGLVCALHGCELFKQAVSNHIEFKSWLEKEKLLARALPQPLSAAYRQQVQESLQKKILTIIGSAGASLVFDVSAVAFFYFQGKCKDEKIKSFAKNWAPTLTWVLGYRSK